MSQLTKKPMLTPLEAASDAGFEGGDDPRLPKPMLNALLAGRPHLLAKLRLILVLGGRNIAQIEPPLPPLFCPRLSGRPLR